MSEQRPAPPGWYPNDDGGTRWWDGQQWTEQTRPPTPAAPTKPRPNWGCAFLVATPIAAVLLFFIIAIDRMPETEEGGPEAAILMCQQFVGDELKAPTTAQYSQMQAFGKEPHWVVTGVVDAENSFGAPIRTGVTCNLLHETGSDQWRAKQVTANERISEEVARELAAEPFDSK